MPNQDDRIRHHGSGGGTASFIIMLILFLLVGGGYYSYVRIQHVREQEMILQQRVAEAARMRAEDEAEKARAEAEQAQLFAENNRTETDVAQTPEPETDIDTSSVSTATAEDGPPQLSEDAPADQFSPAQNEVLDNGRSDSKDPMIWAFDWPDVENATRYHLYVKGANASIPVINKDDLEESTYLKFTNGVIYERHRKGWTWKVRAFVDGEWGEWSEVRTFDVEPANTDPPVE